MFQSPFVPARDKARRPRSSLIGGVLFETISKSDLHV